MDPAEFGISTTPLHHAPYGPITPEALAGANTSKVALITGAARGIGAAIAESLAKSGANVAILDLDIERQADTQQKCAAHGVKVGVYGCDVTDEQTLLATLDQVEQELGPVDVLINNAGILSQRPLLISTFPSFWRQIEVNFKAPLLLTHALLPRFLSRGGTGCIINIASRSGTVDVPMTMGYVTSKAALIRGTHTLQKELGLDGLDEGVGVYALHPGGVFTGMGGSGAEEDVRERYGGVGVGDEEGFRELFRDGPELCGQTCAWLASGRGRELRGFYLDCRQDVRKLLEYGREAMLKEKRNTLGVNFLDGYCNEP
ncbi:NAD(P)-binding protein [Polyplosphaeria fusca]|uniref:NAD(P)-binding protein n=1 Tax=Polyplosphaeria fusca TaxID=682080 RepID=A0A9P4V4G9_9PLEO|nr:NAD(P)-binding protein [Polyplosphaeria fusca]